MAGDDTAVRRGGVPVQLAATHLTEQAGVNVEHSVIASERHVTHGTLQAVLVPEQVEHCHFLPVVNWFAARVALGLGSEFLSEAFLCMVRVLRVEHGTPEWTRAPRTAQYAWLSFSQYLSSCFRHSAHWKHEEWKLWPKA